MKRLETHMRLILKRLDARPLLVMLDFDGTLAPFVSTPSRAKMSKTTHSLVKELSLITPLYIVSGRALEDLKRRVKLPRVFLAGNHGMEWHSGKKVIVQRVAAAAIADVVEARVALKTLAKREGLLLENKGLSFAFHYRSVSSAARPRILTEARAIIAPIVRRGHIEVLDQNRLLDVRPRGWHKGDFVKKILREFPHALPIYVGDDRTDEDAFAVLTHGITIRVGKKTLSAAQYYVATREDVDIFLATLLGSLRSRDS